MAGITDRRGLLSHTIRTRSTGIARRSAIALGAGIALGACVCVPQRALAISTPDDVQAIASNISSTYSDLFAAIKARDFEKANELAHTGSEQVAELQSMIDNPLWVIAQWIPVYGEDVSAVHKLTHILGDLTDNALLPLCECLVQTPLKELFRVNDYGNMDIDMTALNTLVGILHDAIPNMSSAQEELDSIGDLHVEQLNEVVSKARDYIEPLNTKLFKYAELIDCLPQIFDDEGRERLYLVVAQNNVEMRSIGGFPGAWCPVRVNRGTVMFGDVTNVYEVIPVDDTHRLDITDEEFNLFGESISYMPGNDGIIPDFPRVCDLWSQFWKYYQGRDVDGVIAVDPIFFQDVLGLTDGVTLSDGTKIDGTNAARILMHDTYWDNMGSGSAMDSFFSRVASSAVHAIVQNFNEIDLRKFRKVLSAGIEKGNLILWLANEAEEQALDRIGATGAMKYDATSPILGAYISNESYSKIDWWLDRTIEVGSATDAKDGGKTYPVEFSLTNTATWEEIEAANDYIAGENPAKYSKDDMMYWLYFYAPAGGSIEVLDIDGQCELAEAVHNGLQVWFGRAHVQIDVPLKIKLSVTASPDAEKKLSVRTTPTVQDVR